MYLAVSQCATTALCRPGTEGTEQHVNTVHVAVQVDDMVNSNSILYSSGEHPDHVVVIKYVPYVADSKRAMDEYTSEIFMGGRNTIALHNTCEDSLLAAPIILDLVILAELLTRIQVSLSICLAPEPYM